MRSSASLTKSPAARGRYEGLESPIRRLTSELAESKNRAAAAEKQLSEVESKVESLWTRLNMAEVD